MYLLLIKLEYTDNWEMHSFIEEADLKKYLLEAVKKPGEVVVARWMDFSIDVKFKESTPEKIAAATKKALTPKEPVKEEDKSEASEGGPEKDNGAGGSGNGTV